MAYTVKQVREAFPEVQFAGGVGIVLVKGKHVGIGRVAADGEFVPSPLGKELMDAAMLAAKPTSPAKGRGKKATQGDAAPVAAAPDEAGATNAFAAAADEDDL